MVNPDAMVFWPGSSLVIPKRVAFRCVIVDAVSIGEPEIYERMPTF